jgi:hypothetical protein
MMRPVAQEIPDAAATLAGSPESHLALPRRGVSARGRGLVSLIMAALTLVAVIIVDRWPGRTGDSPFLGNESATATSGWGWNRPDAFPQELTRRAYLDHLADSAQEWFRERPNTPLTLARRIAGFRQSCSVLILTAHRPLPAEDRTWLVERCQAWAARLDAHLAAVEAGESWRIVRNRADETIIKLITALRLRD